MMISHAWVGASLLYKVNSLFVGNPEAIAATA
jgi:hypothetical protein